MRQKFKNLFLDARYQESGRARTAIENRHSRRQQNPRRSERGWSRDEPQTKNTEHDENYKAAWWALGILLPVALFILFGSNRSAEVAIDPNSLCPVERAHIVRKTYILIDLSEPLAQVQRTSLQELLEVAAENMATRELLSISQMQTIQRDPREEVQRFCSPDIRRIGQAGSRIQTTDCVAINKNSYTWPRNLGDNTRKDIAAACEEYSRLQAKVHEASKPYNSVNLEQPYSYIVGSIEDAMDDAASEPSTVPARLIVFSDMLQNAGWFSQYRRKTHGEWTIDNLLERRRSAANMGPQPSNNFDEVLLCYLPNRHPIIATAFAKNQHRQMWGNYFSKTQKFKSTEASGCAVAAKELMRG